MTIVDDVEDIQNLKVQCEQDLDTILTVLYIHAPPFSLQEVIDAPVTIQQLLTQSGGAGASAELTAGESLAVMQKIENKVPLSTILDDHPEFSLKYGSSIIDVWNWYVKNN